MSVWGYNLKSKRHYIFVDSFTFLDIASFTYFPFYLSLTMTDPPLALVVTVYFLVTVCA